MTTSAPRLSADTEASAAASSILSELYVGVPLMRGSLLASVDGRVLATDYENGNGAATAAIVASSFALGGKLAEIIGSASVGELTVRTDDGLISLYAVGDRAVLAALTMPDANLGLLHLQARVAAQALAPLVAPLLEVSGSSAS